MARYVAFQLAAYPPSNAPERYPIRRSTLREAHTTGLDSGLRIRFDGAAQKGDSLIEVNAERYGFGWVAQQTCEFEEIVGHHGALGGYAGTIMFLPKRGVGVIVLTNLWRSEPDDVATRVLRALARTGGLVARSPKLSPAFEAAMKRYISLQNKWDEALYAEMIGREKLPEEKGELASYKDRHRTCKGYSLLEVMEPRRARFKLDCERGVLELELLLDDNGKVLAFSGTSRDAPVPAPLRKIGDRIAGLIGKWDERVYKKHLASTRMSHDDTIRSFAALRAQHGTCSVKSAIHTFAEPRLVLACDRGGEVLLTVKVDATNPDAVAAYAFESAVNGLCPVR